MAKINEELRIGRFYVHKWSHQAYKGLFFLLFYFMLLISQLVSH